MVRHTAAFTDTARLVARVRRVRALHGDTTPRQTAVRGRRGSIDHHTTRAGLAVCWALCLILPYGVGLQTRAVVRNRLRVVVPVAPPPLVRDALTRLLNVAPVARLTTVAGTAEVDAWSPNGRYLAVGYSGGALLLWDVARRRLAARVAQAHHRFVGALSWSPDGRLLASAAADGTAVVWDTRAPVLRSVAVIRTAPLHVPAVAFAPWGDTLAVANGLQTVTVWSVSPPGAGGAGVRRARTLRLTGRTTALAWSPDGARLAVGTSEGGVVLWRRDAGWQSVVRALGSPVWALAWAPPGTTLAVGCADGAVRLLAGADLATRSALVAPFHRAPVRQVADFGAPSAPARAKNQTKGTAIHIAAGAAINGLAWSPGGDLLAVTATGVPLRLWRPSSGVILATYHPAWDQNVVSWRPDGTLAAVAMDDGSVVLLRASEPAFPTNVVCRAHVRDWCALLRRPLAPRTPSGVPPVFMGR